VDCKTLKNLNGLQTQINIALINWDPIGMQTMGNSAFEVYWEYLRYIDPILNVIENEKLLHDLIWELAQDMTGFGKENEFVFEQVNRFIERLQTIGKNQTEQA
jgi:hypothetical protein